MIGRALLWLLVALGVAAELARPPAAGPVHWAFFGAIFGAIVSAFGWLAGQAVTVAVTVAQVAIMIGQAIGQFAVLTASVFARVFGFLRSFWSGVLRPFISWSWEQIERLSGWLRRTFEPLIKFLQDVRTEIQKIYDRWLRPIFDTIDLTRRVLQVLATLRVPFARELDRKLAELEGFLLRPILELYRLLNTAMDWINRIVTLDGLLQRLTLIASLVRYQKDALNVWWQSIHRPLTSQQRADYEQPTSARPIPVVASELREYVLNHTGPDQERIDEHALDLLQRLRAVNVVIP
jgi:hypothetical protein